MSRVDLSIGPLKEGGDAGVVSKLGVNVFPPPSSGSSGSGLRIRTAATTRGTVCPLYFIIIFFKQIILFKTLKEM